MRLASSITWGCVALLAWCGSARAGDVPSANEALKRRIDASVLSVLAEERTPSASIAVVLDGRLAYAAAYGVATRSPPRRADRRTRYQLASISKSFTAQALLLLEQDGKLSLEDPVSRWLPGLSGGDQVSLRDLLQHTSGYPDHYPQTYPAGPRTRPIDPDQIIAEWGRHPLLFAPGSKFRYSNLNYAIAGRIVELVAGEPLFDFLDHRVFSPLGMTQTIDLDRIDSHTRNLATGYVRPALAALQPAPAEGRGWSFGAGQIVTTATDLSRWDAAFLAGTLLSPTEAAKEIATPQLADGSRSGYALGLFVAHRDRTIYSHVGQGLGFLAVNRLYPAEHAAIVVLTNDSSSAAFSRIADRLAYLTIAPTPADAQARSIFASLRANHRDRSLFSDDFNRYFDARMAKCYADSLGPLGPVESFDLRSQDEADGITTRIYEILAGGHRLRLVEQVLADGKIESFQVQAA